MISNTVRVSAVKNLSIFSAISIAIAIGIKINNVNIKVTRNLFNM